MLNDFSTDNCPLIITTPSTQISELENANGKTKTVCDSSGNKTLIDSIRNTIVSIVWFLHIGLYIAVNHLHWPWWQNQKELQCFCAYHVS
jgi:hypothetical protein